MGRMAIEDMIEQDKLYGKGDDSALAWHLRSNHFPPVPLVMIPACKRAIANAENGNWDKKVRLPDGCTFRGSNLAPTRDMVIQHHLDSFIRGEVYD